MRTYLSHCKTATCRATCRGMCPAIHPATRRGMRCAMRRAHAHHTYSFRCATTFLGRMKGLLGKHTEGGVLVLAPCNDVHTWGMTHCIDVAFFDARGVVLDAHEQVKSCKRLKNKHAAFVVERISIAGSEWFAPGQQIALAVFDALDLP